MKPGELVRSREFVWLERMASIPAADLTQSLMSG